MYTWKTWCKEFLTALVSKFIKNELFHFCCFSRSISISNKFNFNSFELYCIGQSTVGEGKWYLISYYEDTTILIGNYETNTVTMF